MLQLALNVPQCITMCRTHRAHGPWLRLLRNADLQDEQALAKGLLRCQNPTQTLDGITFKGTQE
jgi:hypothetical protein